MRSLASVGACRCAVVALLLVSVMSNIEPALAADNSAPSPSSPPPPPPSPSFANDFTPARPVSRRLIYPIIANRYNQQGTVGVGYEIETDGSLVGAHVVRSSGYPQLDAAGILSVGYWQDTPALMKGVPIVTRSETNLVFYLVDSPSKGQWPDRPPPPLPEKPDDNPLVITVTSDGLPAQTADGTFQFVLYPHLARRRAEHGRVTLAVLVYKESLVRDARVLVSSGSTQLDAAAMVSAGYWTFLPAVKYGDAIDAWKTVVVDFELADSPPATPAAPVGPILPDDNQVTTPQSNFSQRIGGHVYAPAHVVGRTHNCASFFPMEAVRSGISGTVRVAYRISTDGSIHDVTVKKTSGSKVLDDAAVACVSSAWRDTPATVDGKPVESNSESDITFNYEQAPPPTSTR